MSNSSDLVDVTFAIKERKSGEFKVSAGWSDTDGAIFDINLQQDNFLGYGKNIGLKASKSTVNTSLQFLLTDPYYTFDGVARTVTATLSSTDVSSLLQHHIFLILLLLELCMICLSQKHLHLE